MKTFLTLFLSAAILAGCNRAAEVNYEKDSMHFSTASESYEDASAAEPENDRLDESAFEGRKLIKTGSLEFETTELDKVGSEIKRIAHKYNAYISNENSFRSGNRVSRNLTLRIPSENFDSVVVRISEGVEHFDNKSIQVNDVTEEYLDVEARLKTKKELESRYYELLKKAVKVSEMLEIERELGNLRADIESIEGRLKFLKDQVAYSTLTINYYTKIASDNRFGLKVKQGIVRGWDLLQYLVIGLVNLWPFILILIAVIWLTRRKLRRRN